MDSRKNKAVAFWLLTGVGMIIVQTLLGGITRLTGSGLSITKWDPIFGFLPPLNARQWDAAFNGYKQIGQFKYMNSFYTLDEFKSIFFWEWLHRAWARLLGVVFLIGFAFFLVKKYFQPHMVRPLIVLFLLGGLQGAIGWVMVASGLNDAHLYVDHIRLALHFIAAMMLACYTLWFALQLLVPDTERCGNGKQKPITLAIVVLLFVQLTFGAFMAGLKAAQAAPTWPTINGMWFPDNFGTASIFQDKIAVHFIHRTLGYLLLCLVGSWGIYSTRLAGPGRTILRKTVWIAMALVLLQVVLGITALLSAPLIRPGHFGVFEILAEMHQMVAMLLLVTMITSLYVTSGQSPSKLSPANQ